MLHKIEVDRTLARHAAQYLAKKAFFTTNEDRALEYMDLSEILTIACVQDDLTTIVLTDREITLLENYQPLSKRIQEALS